MSHDAGDYYREKRERADKAREALREAKARGASYEEIHNLKRALERAEYVGD